MFVSKKTHEYVVGLLTSQYEARLSALQDQVSDLKRLVFSPTSATEIPIVAREADEIITGNSDAPPLPNETAIDEIREFDRILSGEYEDLNQ